MTFKAQMRTKTQIQDQVEKGACIALQSQGSGEVLVQCWPMKEIKPALQQELQVELFYGTEKNSPAWHTVSVWLFRQPKTEGSHVVQLVLWKKRCLVLALPCSIPGRFWVLPKEGHPEGLTGHSRGFCVDQVVLCFSSGIPDTSVCRKVRKGGLKTAKQVCLQGRAGAAIHGLVFERNIPEWCHLQNFSPLFFQKYQYYKITTTYNSKLCLSLKCLYSC